MCNIITLQRPTNMLYLCRENNNAMRLRIFLGLMMVMSTVAVISLPLNVVFDRSAFYAAMASSKLEEIDAQLALLKTASIAEKEAYEGALLMKKSGLASKPKDKLNLFKAGRSKLESSIAKDKENTELRFLRLIIQEHAPKLVNYRNELDNDSQIIRTNYRSLPPVVQQAIIDYSKKSTVLKPSFF